MRRRIIIGLGLLVAIFLVTSTYVVVTLGASTASLEQLVALHQVETLREQFLVRVRGAQLDLALGPARSPKDRAMVVADIDAMEKTVTSCAGCHHSPEVTARLGRLRDRTGRYRDALLRALPDPGGRPAAPGSDEVAVRIGRDLVEEVREMIDATSATLEQHTGRTLAAISHSEKVILLVMVLGPALAFLAGFLFLTWVARNLEVLLYSTRALRRGKLDHRVAPLPGEFGELAQSFNEMASSLQEQIQQMRRVEQMVVVGQLAAGLAHEIKNPLGGIKAAMQVLGDEGNLVGEDRELVRRVGREVVRLEDLLRSFLLFAKPARPQLVELDVNDCVESALALQQQGSGAGSGLPGKVSVSRDLAPLPPTMADPGQLQQVFLNLVLNAVDAMPQGGVLDVRTRREGEQISVELGDTGWGISPEHAGHLFRPFFTTKRKGTGLGLAISKQLVEQHGGTITFTSREEGGTVFRVRLPLRAPTPEAA